MLRRAFQQSLTRRFATSSGSVGSSLNQAIPSTPQADQKHSKSDTEVTSLPASSSSSSWSADARDAVVLIRNLPLFAHGVDLSLKLHETGTVVSIARFPNESFTSSLALVQYSTKLQAQETIQILNDQLFLDQVLQVSSCPAIECPTDSLVVRAICYAWDSNENHRSPPINFQPFRHMLCLDNLPTEPFAEEEFKRFFEAKTGFVYRRASFPVKADKSSLGFGFVYCRGHQVQAALEKLHGETFLGHQLSVTLKGRPSLGQALTRRSVFIRGLPQQVQASAVAERFASVGDVSQVTIKELPSGTIGIVRFDSEQLAQSAVKDLNGCEFHGGTLTVEPAKPRVKPMPKFKLKQAKQKADQRRARND